MRKNPIYIGIIVIFLCAFFLGLRHMANHPEAERKEGKSVQIGAEMAAEMADIIELKNEKTDLSVTDEIETATWGTPDQEMGGNSYDAYLKKIWIVDQEERDFEEPSFVITEIKDGEIEGCLDIYGAVESDYCHQYLVESSSFVAFHGTVSEKTAVSSFEHDGNRTEFVIRFCGDDRIQALLRCDETGMYESFRFRPYNISDEKDFYDISSAEVSLSSWGEVSLVWGSANSCYSYPEAYMVNDKGDIFYEFDCSGGISGSKLWDIFVRDMNGDGLEDIMAVACVDESPEGYRMATVYYQLEDGTFQKERPNWDAMDLPKRYYGNYEIVQFCPAGTGKDMSDEEAEKMLGRTVVMQNGGLSITYDSERGAGVRKDREPARGADGILEFRDERGEWDYYWESAEPETLGYGGTLDEALRAAVGEEYYNEIDGIIHSHCFGVQQFYTLKGGQEMILYSLVTGQYFILSKTETMAECTQDQETDGNSYDAYLKKIWIVDRGKRDFEEPSFVITEIKDGEIEGCLDTHGAVESDYCSQYRVEGSSFVTFHGTVSEGTAVSSFEYDGNRTEFMISFCGDDRIQASLRCDETGMYESFWFRPYNISDEKDFYDISSAEVSLSSWGEVSLVWGTANSRHPYPKVYMVNDKNDILYEFDCGINGCKVWDIFVWDMNGDGLEDIMTVACLDEEPGGYRNAIIYYQLEDGTFQRDDYEWDRQNLPKRYYGNYEIVRFCPADGGEEILGEEAVESMLGRTVVMQEDLFITYDSESRAGVRKDREIVQGADSIFEFHATSGGVWEETQPETMGYGGTRDEILRRAVGDEYYEKIDGIITASGTQRIYTLQGGQEMILHSLVTGQYFILSKIE